MDAALFSHDSNMNQLKSDLHDAQRAALHSETRLQPLTESLELYKHKYKTCLSKIAELESTLHSHEEDLKEARAQVSPLINKILATVQQVVHVNTNAL